jgi:Domain of unknown function (DUF5667)
MAVTPLDRRRAIGFALVLERRDRFADPRFAPLLTVVDSMRAVAEPGPSPRPEFRDALRVRLLAAAAAPAVTASGAPPAAQRPYAGGVRRWRSRLVAAGAGAALAMGCVAGLAFMGRNALPGDALYGVKRGVEDVRLSLAWGEEAKGRQELTHAGTRLGEVEGLLGRAGPRPADASSVAELDATMRDMTASIEHGRILLTGVYRDDREAATLEPLRDFSQRHRGRLEALQPVLPPQLADRQAALIAQLDRIDTQIAQLTAGVPGGTRAPGAGPGSGPGSGPGAGTAGATPGPGSSVSPAPGGGLTAAPGGGTPLPGGTGTAGQPGGGSSPSATPGGGISAGVSLPPLVPGLTPTVSVTLPPLLP